MAQFSLNPAALSLGAATGFTAVTGTGTYTLTIEDAADLVRVLRLKGPGGDLTGARLIRLDAPGTPANVQLFVKARWRARANSGGNYGFTAVVRDTSTDAGTDKDYYSIASNQLGRSFRTVVNNTSTDLAATDAAFAPDLQETFCFLLDAQGTTIREKHWEGDETAEPGTYAESVTNGDHASGAVGFNFNQDATDVEILFIGVGTDGDEAPRAPSSALAAGTASLVDVTDTTADLACTAASGGTSPYTYQWQHSADGTTGWADLTGETALTLALTGLTPETTQYYRCVATDSAAASANSNVVTVTTEATPIDLNGVTVTTTGSMGSAQTSCSVRYGGKVFVGFARDTGSFYAAQVDEATGTVEGEILIGTLTADRHMNPAMDVLPDGRIVVVYDDHGAARMRVSLNAGDVLGGWDTERTPTGSEFLYVQPVVTEEGSGTERIYVFYTRYNGGSGARVACFVYTDDRGATWSSEAVVFENAGDWVYAAARRSTETGRILIVLADDNSSQGPADGYLMIYDPSDGSWTAADGTALTLPESPASPRMASTRFYDQSANGNRYLEFMGFAHEHAGRICIPFQARAAGAGADRYVRALFESGAWTLQTVYEAADDVLRNAPIMQTGDDNTLFGIVNVSGTLDVYRFTTDDDGTTWAMENLTQNSLPAVTDPAFDIWNLHEVKRGTVNDSPWALNRWDWGPSADTFDGNVWLYLGDTAPVLTALRLWMDGIAATDVSAPA